MATLSGNVDVISSSKYLTATLTYAVSTSETEHTLTLQSLTIKAVGTAYFVGKIKLYYGGTCIQTYTAKNTTGLAAGSSVSIPLDFNASVQKTTRTTAAQTKQLAIYHAPSSSTTYTNRVNTDISITARTKYVNTYYPNGGSGSSSTQDHYYGYSFSAKAANTYSRTNHSFARWNTTAAGTGTSYTAGTSYTVNSNLALYAQWTQVYATPQVSILRAYRCNSQGNADDEGAYAKVVGTYSIWNTSTTNSVSTASGKVPVCTVNSVSQTAVSGSGDVDNTYSTPIASGNWMSGQFTFKVDADMSTDSSYSVSVSFTDTQGGTTGRTTATGTGAAAIGTAFYTIDILEGGHGIAFGGTARDDGVMGLWMPIRQYIGNNYSVAPATDGYFDVLVDYDKAGNQIGYMAINNLTTSVYRSYAVTNPRSTASNKTAAIYLSVADDGTKAFTTNGVPLRVDSGGTGQTATTTTSTVSDILSAASGVTINSAQYAQWGKIASLYVSCKKNAALTAGTHNTMATIKAGKRPPFESAGVGPGGNADCAISSDGSLLYRPNTTIAANTNVYIRITYLLA